MKIMHYRFHHHPLHNSALLQLNWSSKVPNIMKMSIIIIIFLINLKCNCCSLTQSVTYRYWEFPVPGMLSFLDALASLALDIPVRGVPNFSRLQIMRYLDFD